MVTYFYPNNPFNPPSFVLDLFSSTITFFTFIADMILMSVFERPRHMENNKNKVFKNNHRHEVDDERGKQEGWGGKNGEKGRWEEIISDRLVWAFKQVLFLSTTSIIIVKNEKNQQTNAIIQSLSLVLGVFLFTHTSQMDRFFFCLYYNGHASDYS